MKHAFPGELEGEILLELSFGEADSVYLSVSDNGIGMPQDFVLECVESFGLDLVKTLVEELQGHVKLEHGEGCHWSISFRQSDEE